MESSAKIKLETNFANAAYQDFKSKRFGLTPCCFSDLESAYIEKQACNWEELQAEVLEPSSVYYSVIDCSTNPSTSTTEEPILFPPPPQPSESCDCLEIQISKLTSGLGTVEFTNCFGDIETSSFIFSDENLNQTFKTCRLNGTAITYVGIDDYTEVVGDACVDTDCSTYEATLTSDVDGSFRYLDCFGNIVLQPYINSGQIQQIYTFCGLSNQPPITCSQCTSFNVVEVGSCAICPPVECVELNYRLTYDAIEIGGRFFNTTDCEGVITPYSVPTYGEVYEVCSVEPPVISGLAPASIEVIGECSQCVESNWEIVFGSISCISCPTRSYTATTCDGITTEVIVGVSGGTFNVCSTEEPIAPLSNSIIETGECPPPCVNSLWEVSVPDGVFSSVEWINCEGGSASQIVVGPNTIEVCASAEPTGGVAVNLGLCPPPPCALIQWEISFPAGVSQAYNYTNCEGATIGALVPCNFPCPAIVVNVCSLEGSPPTAPNGTVTEIGICSPD